MKYKVVEKFVSINGEGLHSGELAVFIRFFGCNLRCEYCDSKYSYDKNEATEELTEKELFEYVERQGVKNVTLTGGEPLLQSNIKELVLMLTIHGYRVEIETNGSVSIAELAELPYCYRPSFTLDYKTECAGNAFQKLMKQSNYAYLNKMDCVKFVVGSLRDLQIMKYVVEQNNLLARTNVLVSACFGMIELEDIASFLIQHRLNGVKMQLQIHKFIWDAAKRGV